MHIHNDVILAVWKAKLLRKAQLGSFKLFKDGIGLWGTVFPRYMYATDTFLIKLFRIHSEKQTENTLINFFLSQMKFTQTCTHNWTQLKPLIITLMSYTQNYLNSSNWQGNPGHGILEGYARIELPSQSSKYEFLFVNLNRCLSATFSEVNLDQFNKT
jgi:hypothetical protein